MNLDKENFRKITIGFVSVAEAFGHSLGGVAIGYMLDLWLVSTKPWLTIVGALAGMVSGFYRMYKMYIKEEFENDGKK